MLCVRVCMCVGNVCIICVCVCVCVLVCVCVCEEFCLILIRAQKSRETHWRRCVQNHELCPKALRANVRRLGVVQSLSGETRRRRRAWVCMSTHVCTLIHNYIIYIRKQLHTHTHTHTHTCSLVIVAQFLLLPKFAELELPGVPGPPVALAFSGHLVCHGQPLHVYSHFPGAR